MKKLYLLILFIPLLLSVPTYADSVQSYEFNVSGVPSNNLIVYTKNGTNPYSFTPKYISFEAISELTTCTPLYYMRFYYTSSLSNSDVIGTLRLATSCSYPISYLAIPDNIMNLSTMDGIYLAASEFRADVNYSIKVYSGNPLYSEPDCPDCPDCNEPAIVSLFKDGFWGVATALVSLIVPVLALFLVFRLVHDFFWGRG